METFNNICKQFREILEKNYNEILISLDQIINSLIDFRAKYSVYYKEKVINSVQTLKILKMFYSNYYYDIHKAEKGNDFRIYKYLNQINYELDEVNLINNKTNANEKLELLKECSDYLNENINNILDITFCFRKVNNGFRKYQSIQRCDEKNLKRILKVNEHKIITCGEGYYMNCLEDNNGEFSTMSKIPVKDKITAILLFKEGNILTSFGKHSHYNIQEWIINENFSNIKDNNTDVISLNKSFNDSDSYDNLSLNKSMTAYDLSLTKNNTMTQNLLNNSLYERATSFLSNHKDDINVICLDILKTYSKQHKQLTNIFKKTKNILSDIFQLDKEIEIISDILGKYTLENEEYIQLYKYKVFGIIRALILYKIIKIGKNKEGIQLLFNSFLNLSELINNHIGGNGNKYFNENILNWTKTITTDLEDYY
jgi:hypothetical protein